MYGLPADPESALHLAGRIAAVGAIIGWCETLAHRSALSDTALRGWAPAGTDRPTLAARLLGRALHLLFAYPNVLAIAGIGLMAAVMLLGSGTPGAIAATASAVSAIGYALMRARGGQGAEAADSLLIVIFSAVALGEFSGSRRVAIACALFIAAQAILAYAVSGLFKLRSPAWRTGTALPAILRTDAHGHGLLARLALKHRPLARAGGAGVILFELAMAIAPFAPPAVLACCLAAALLFYAGASLVLGAGSLVCAFAATWPALWYLNARLWS